jgi:hypothetical protein
MTRSKLTVLCAAGLAALIAAGTIAPAFADDDHDRGRREWRQREWHEHEWRENEWREHHPYGYHPYGYYAAPAPVYAPPAVVYTPPPAPVYVPPVAPSLNVVVPLRF